MAPSEQPGRIASGEIHAGFIGAPLSRLPGAKQLKAEKVDRHLV